ncbi:hypothetical protein DL98DRAFT_536828 [Cadophora sp. DSE1049]|nr:hypothetical protein DL98DRAFT_536828 [Cadophora sp. DSE1049]
MQEKAARKKAKKRNRGCNLGTAHTPRKSVYDVFVASLLPELLKEGADTREKAKTRIDNWIQHGKRWAILIEYFGSGILLLIPQDLTNDNLRNMKFPEVDALVEQLDSYRPSHQANIQNLTSLLLPLIEDRCLPEQRLQLETLTESQITSGEHAARSLKELFEHSDDCSAFLTESAYSDLSRPDIEASPDPSMNLGEQADSRTALPGPDFDPDDPSIGSYTELLNAIFSTYNIVDYLSILSPTTKHVGHAPCRSHMLLVLALILVPACELVEAQKLARAHMPPLACTTPLTDIPTRRKSRSTYDYTTKLQDL